MHIVLYDIDSKIPNLALMKLSSHFKQQGERVTLLRWKSGTGKRPVEADRYFASTVFYTERSRQRIAQLQQLYGDRITIGGSGFDLSTRLPLEVEQCFPR